MKATYKFLTLAMATLALSACNDLDTKYEGAYVSTEQKEDVIANDPSALLYSVTGISADFSKYMTLNTSHIDYGYASLMLYLDSRGMDLTSPDIGYNWYTYAAEMSDCQTTGYGCTFSWRYPFSNLFICNSVLSAAGDESDDPTVQFYIAQARAFRAFDYFVLAQLFQFTYDGHQNDPCVPIITEKNALEITETGAPRASVAEVYDFILKDLDAAIEYLTECGIEPADVLSDKPKRLISLATAYGLRARVNLVMNRWAEAAADAEAAIENFDGAPATLAEVDYPTFWSMVDANGGGNWMWGIAIAETDRVVTSGIVNFPSHMGSFYDNSYAAAGAWRSINSSLFNRIPKTDVRYGWFLDGSSTYHSLTGDPDAASYQQWAKSYEMPPYTQVKYGPYNWSLAKTNVPAADIPLMRIEEMYYIYIEAMAMAGQPGPAVQLLNEFVSTLRDPKYAFSGSSAEAIQEEVWFQRRIEFWGEGISYFDIMRLKKPVDRRSGSWEPQWTYYVPAESNVLRFPIPQSEIEANKLISPADNNPAAPQPSPVAN